jgi:hypothetical protein
VSRLLLVASVSLLAACGAGQDVERAAVTEPEPPLWFPVATTAVPGWLDEVRPYTHGRWVAAFRSPDDETLLAQWSGECEIPVAYFVPLDTRKPRPVVPPVRGTPLETVAVGWDEDGRAGVFFAGGVCGQGDERPGLYLVALDGDREFVTDDVAEMERWQAERR